MRGLVINCTRRWTWAPRQPEVPLTVIPSPQGVEQASERDIDLGLWAELRGEGMRLLKTGFRLRALLQDALVFPQAVGVGNQNWNFHHTASFSPFHLAHGSLGREGETNLSSLFRGTFSPTRSQQALFRLPSSLTATWATPSRPPSTSALKLVPSQTGRGRVHVLGLIDATRWWGGVSDSLNPWGLEAPPTTELTIPPG